MTVASPPGNVVGERLGVGGGQHLVGRAELGACDVSSCHGWVTTTPAPTAMTAAAAATSAGNRRRRPAAAGAATVLTTGGSGRTVAISASTRARSAADGATARGLGQQRGRPRGASRPRLGRSRRSRGAARTGRARCRRVRRRRRRRTGRGCRSCAYSHRVAQSDQAVPDPGLGRADREVEHGGHFRVCVAPEVRELERLALDRGEAAPGPLGPGGPRARPGRPRRSSRDRPVGSAGGTSCRVGWTPRPTGPGRPPCGARS